MNRRRKQIVTQTGTARAGIRISHVGKRQMKDELKRSEEVTVLRSPSLQLDRAERYCESISLNLDRDASLRHVELNVATYRLPWRKRRDLIEHLSDARHGEFQHIVFYKLSRIGRNFRESLEICDEFENAGVQIHTSGEGKNWSADGSRFHRNILLAAADEQSHDLSDWVADAIRDRSLDGLPHGALPLWLVRGPDGITIRDGIADQFTRLGQLRLEGLGQVSVARKMNQEGYRTPSGREWTEGMVAKYLSPLWIDRLEGTGFLHPELAEDDPERIVIPNAYPRLWDADFASAIRAVQNAYAANPLVSPIVGAGTWQENKARRGKRNGRLNAETAYLVTGIAYCAVCGCRLNTAQRSESLPDIHKYFCINARTTAQPHGDGGVSIASNSLEDGVLRVLRLALHDPPPPPVKPVRRDGKVLRSRKTAETKQERLKAAYLAGAFSLEEFLEEKAGIEAEMLALDVQEQAEVETTDLTRARSLASEETELTRERLRQLVLLVIARVEVPVYLPDVLVRSGLKTLRKHARVTLTFPNREGHKTFLVPLYTSRFTGQRGLPFSEQT